ncbi:MAG: hypothetical protein R2857_11650 [Vampirovibrionales bacterium]
MPHRTRLQPFLQAPSVPVRLQQAQTERYPSDNETGLTPAPANTAFGANLPPSLCWYSFSRAS